MSDEPVQRKRRKPSDADRLVSERLYEMLGDGQWRPVVEVTRQLSRMVPPGEALRYATRHREARGITEPRSTLDDAVRSGATQIVIRSLRSRVQRGTLELSGSDGRGVYRDPSVRVRWPYAGMVSLSEMGRHIGMGESTLPQMVRRANDEMRREMPEVIDRPLGRYTRLADAVHWARFCALHARPLSGMSWVVIGPDREALWNHATRGWEPGDDGALISRRRAAPAGEPLP